jgi:hypothetical protein
LLAQENTLKNICLLIECMHLVSSREITNRCSKKFAKNYQVYPDTSRLVFSKSRILPNHHYALHIPAKIQWWGSLIGVSEIPGERLIGLLQKCNSNNSKSMYWFVTSHKMIDDADNVDIGFSEGWGMTCFCQLQRPNAQNELLCAENKYKDLRKKWIKIEDPSYNAILRFAQSKDLRL